MHDATSHVLALRLSMMVVALSNAMLLLHSAVDVLQLAVVMLLKLLLLLGAFKLLLLLLSVWLLMLLLLLPLLLLCIWLLMLLLLRLCQLGTAHDSMSYLCVTVYTQMLLVGSGPTFLHLTAATLGKHGASATAFPCLLSQKTAGGLPSAACLTRLCSCA